MCVENLFFHHILVRNLSDPYLNVNVSVSLQMKQAKEEATSQITMRRGEIIREMYELISEAIFFLSNKTCHKIRFNFQKGVSRLA